MPKWTEQQRDAIADRGHSLIVCAAAGSGKTAVLVERIVQLVREGCPIENMLVVTFTNAAAGEMRQRIGEALGKAAREDPALGEQVMALFRELNDEGRTIVMITHNEEIAQMADRILQIEDGKIVSDSGLV